MRYFRETTHLSEILEGSQKTPVIIFIFSSECGSSSKLAKELEEKIVEKTISVPVYKVTVQLQPVLSEKIESWFHIKHESPQIIIVSSGKVTYTAHHKEIAIENFVFK